MLLRPSISLDLAMLCISVQSPSCSTKFAPVALLIIFKISISKPDIEPSLFYIEKGGQLSFVPNEIVGCSCKNCFSFSVSCMDVEACMRVKESNKAKI